MAIDTKDNLKAMVTDNKLLAQLLTNIIDSYLDAELPHNNLEGLQGGAVNEYNHLTDAQVALVDDTTHNNLTSIQGGTTGEYYHLTAAQHANVDVWVKEGTDRVLYGGVSGTTELQRVDVNGNIANNSAAIPGDINPIVKYVFDDINCVGTIITGAAGFRVVCTGCYPNSGASRYTAKRAGVITVLIQNDTEYAHYKYTATLGEDVALASFTRTPIA